jgi:hypothetical protein
MLIYVEVLELLPNDGSRSFTKKEFAQKYDLCYVSMSPKYVKVPRDCCNEKVAKLFGLIVNKNDTHYMENGNLVFIEKIERLWMIIHQKPHILVGRVITLGMVRCIVCEEKGISMNLVVYVEWTN